jgi:hypothetical protein
MRMTLKSLLILAALLVAWHGAKAMAEERVLDEFEELLRNVGVRSSPQPTRLD